MYINAIVVPWRVSGSFEEQGRCDQLTLNLVKS